MGPSDADGITHTGGLIVRQHHDGLQKRPSPAGPERLGLDLGPLPNPPSAQQRRDPAAVARQWAGLKVLTSGPADGPLWPYSVAAHLPALSDPEGQYTSLRDASPLSTVVISTYAELPPT